MAKAIRLYYHDGFYNLKNPIETLLNLVKYGKIHHPVYNIGDQISPIIVAHFSGRQVKHVPPFIRGKMVAVGSVLASVKPGDTIWGSGLMKADHVQYVKKVRDFRINAVRGPETRRVLLESGYDCPAVYGDPGLLMPLVFPRSRSAEFALGIIPHHSQIADFAARDFGKSTLLIPPKQHWEEFITNICRCEMIVSSSLHGVILADAYGVPALPMVHGTWLHGTPFKFQDYFRSTGREAQFVGSDEPLDPASVASKIEALGKPDIDLRPLLAAFPFPRSDQSYVEQGTYLMSAGS